MHAWNVRWLPPIALAAAVFALACGDDDGGMTPDSGTSQDATAGDATPDAQTTEDGGEQPGNLVEVAQDAGNFSTLLSAAERVGLDSTLANGGPFTVFAPTDTAFENLGADLSSLSDEELEQILSYHVVEGEVASSEIPSDPPIADTTAGLTLWFDTSDGVMVNDATVTTPDVQASNGVIHVIDTVLMPPDVPAMAGFAGLSSLTGALNDAGLVSDLQGEGPFTVFAPTESAFSEVDTSGLSNEELANVLLYHVISGSAVESSQIPSDPPIANSMATNEWDNPLTLWFDTSDGVTVNDASVAIADIKVTNGVIHVVDTVLMPPTIVDMAGHAGLTELSDALGNASGDLPSTLSGSGPFTVLAPTNMAFMDASSTLSGLDSDQLRDALMYHVLDTGTFSMPVTSSDVSDGSVPTLLGQDLTASTSGGVSFTDANGDSANVAIADVHTSNGVIHVIDQVLVPSL